MPRIAQSRALAGATLALLLLAAAGKLEADAARWGKVIKDAVLEVKE